VEEEEEFPLPDILKVDELSFEVREVDDESVVCCGDWLLGL